MRKMYLLLNVVLVLFLASCTGSKIMEEIPDSDHYRIGFATETHFEMGFPENYFYKVHHAGVEYYVKEDTYAYYPQEDGSTIVVDIRQKPYVGYKMYLNFTFPDVNVRDLHEDVENKTFTSGFISSKMNYRDAEYNAFWVISEHDIINYFIIYNDEEYIYEYEDISVNHDLITEYTLYEGDWTDEFFFSYDYLSLTEDNQIAGDFFGIDILIDYTELYAYITTENASYRWDFTTNDVCFVLEDETIDCNPVYIDGISSEIRFVFNDDIPSNLFSQLVDLQWDLREFHPRLPRTDE